MLVSEFFAQVLFEGHDIDQDTWNDEKLFGYLNDACRQVVVAKPTANSKRSVLKLTPDTVLQELPSDGVALLKVASNMGANGATPGRPVLHSEMASLDAIMPDWREERDAVIANYFYDIRFGRNYYVYPGPVAAPEVWVELFYAAYPAKVEAKGDSFPLEDVYKSAVKNYMLYLLFTKELDDANSASKATHYLSGFAQDLNLKVTAEGAYKPV